MRLFAALPLPRNVAMAMDQGLASARATYPRFNWVRGERMHFTLHFFGDLPDECVQFLYHIFEEDASLVRPPIPARLGLPGKFPEKGPPRVLWVGLEEGRDELKDYWQMFESKLIPMHLDPDPRGFQPHLTVARTGHATVDRGWVDHIQVPRMDFIISECVLYQSILCQGGVAYLPLKRVAFEEGERESR